MSHEKMLDIRVVDAVTCMYKHHRQKKGPRPTCIKIPINDGEDIQICLECWESLKNDVEEAINEHERAWSDFMVGCLKKEGKKR